MKSSLVKLLVFIFLQLLCTFCSEGKNDNNSEITLKGTETNNIFVSHLFYVPETAENEFIRLLQNQYLPIWHKLKNENIIYELSVFKLTKIDSTTTDGHLCNYLVLAELCQGIKSGDFLNAAKFNAGSLSDVNPIFQILRTEILNCVPNAYFPALNSENTAEIDFLIEFIAVKDSAHFLKEYYDLMNVYFGPLNGALVKGHKLYNIYMMETAEIVFQTDSNLTWNQIHLSGDYPELFNLDWDSLYTESFRRIFSCELDSVWALMPPALSTSFDCRGRFIKQLHVK
jgi:hypothetical protein